MIQTICLTALVVYTIFGEVYYYTCRRDIRLLKLDLEAKKNIIRKLIRIRSNHIEEIKELKGNVEPVIFRYNYQRCNHSDSNIDIDKEAIEQINHKLFKELVNWYKKNPDLIKIETVNTPTDFGILVTHTATIKLIPLKP